MNPQLLQMLLPYLMQLFQGQGSGAGGQNPLASLFGQNAQNAFAPPTGQPTGGQNMLQPTMGSSQAPAGVVGGQTPVTGNTTPDASVVPSPQNQISPTGAPQSLGGIWNSLFAGMQNNALAGGQSPGAAGFGPGG